MTPEIAFNHNHRVVGAIGAINTINAAQKGGGSLPPTNRTRLSVLPCSGDVGFGWEKQTKQLNQLTTTTASAESVCVCVCVAVEREQKIKYSNCKQK